ncbi:MAG: hypothetical protein A2V76_08945 [Candidatus Aminicenantes bacterium RBG_16_63_14]|nr:MAG: hypothetical protein A2V76_08945 [Candidatus Aminicenantes bacterium RBG_16_63_14]OGD29015.1 MAG: hypothetical protein A2V57_04850 [Candidatus Aminicenantes bacterium RBG_19FT_COMBO_65_30]
MKKTGSAAAPFWKEAPLVDEREIFTELAAKKGSSLFLGRYSLNEVLAVLNKKGFLKEARKRFLWPLAYELDSSAYPLQRLQIYLREPGPENLIVDVKVKETEFVPKETAEGLPLLPPQKALAFEWLTLQNPLVKPGEPFAPLPGQTRPGLRLRAKIMDLFLYLARLIHKDCLLAFPAYFHNAVLFSRYFHFWNPRKEAEVLAIRRTFSHMPFRQLAWVVHLNCLRREDGTVYEWAAEEQLYPMTRPLKDYFDSRRYKDVVRTGRKNPVFSVDWAEFERRSTDIPAFCGGP